MKCLGAVLMGAGLLGAVACAAGTRADPPVEIHPLFDVASAAQQGAPEAPPHERIERDRLMDLIAELPEKRSAVGLGQHRDGLRSAQEMLRERLAAMGYEVHDQRIDFSTGDERQGPPDTWLNFWVDIRGGERPEEVLVLGAHFDAVPTSPGADDNATGTSALLELARVLRESEPKRTIRLVFFNLEEIGLIGSRQFTQDVLRPRIDAGEERVLGMLSLEMLGYYSDEPDSQSSPVPAIRGVFEPPSVGDFIAMVGRREDQPITRPFARAMGELELEPEVLVIDFLPFTPDDMYRSDHSPFWRIGVPAAMLTDTANFRNPHYHKPTDTLETIDAERFEGVVRQMAHAVWTLANAEVEFADPPPAEDE